jgi:hypothetical protein
MSSSFSRAFAAGAVASVLAVVSALATASPASAAPAGTSQTFGVTGTVQTWTVPAGVTQIYVDIAGAQGGASYGWGGAGAVLSGTLSVTPGQTLNILVGGIGANGVRFSSGSGGGGGSFIYTTPDLAGVLAAAGGGGGAPSNDFASSASITTSGTNGLNGGGAGGTGGQGGGGSSAGGGGGVLTDGGSGGLALANGGGGGGGSAPGGYGGGGGNNSSYAGGGGGGYSGGGGGQYNGNNGGGGGGGSFFAGTLTSAAATQWGNGSVTIVLPAPAVAGISPATIETGSSPTITITGSYVTGATAVSFGSTPAASFTVVSDTVITATVPAGLPAGTYDTTVVSPNGTSAASAADQLTSSPATITLSPGTLPDAQNGQTYSASFSATGGTGPYTYAVTGGALPTGLAFQQSGVLSGTPVAVGDATVTVTVTDVYGSAASAVYALHIAPGAPVVNLLTPAGGTIDGGTTLTLTGSGFTGASAVLFGSVAATSFTVQSDTSITTVAPASRVGAVDITVVTPRGTSAANAATRFTYAPATAVPAGKLASTGSDLQTPFLVGVALLLAGLATAVLALHTRRRREAH